MVATRPNPRKTAFQVLFIVALVSLGGGYLALFSGKPKEADSMAEHSSYHAAADCTIDNLWAWLEKHGVLHKKLKTGYFIVQDVGTGTESYEDLMHKERGVYTQIGLEKGQEILSIPNEILLDEPKFLATPVGKVIAGHYKGLNQFDYLALLLLHERGKGRKSLWYPYLCTLPDYALYKKIFPIFWTQAQLAKASERVQTWVKAARFNMNQKYNMLFPFLSEKYPDLFPAKTHKIQDFGWAYFVVMSRNWSIKNEAGKDGNVLVPLADLLNHDRGAAYVSYPQKKLLGPGGKDGVTYFSLVSNRDYNPGEQVYDVYGDKSCNDYNLVMYGFTQPNNPNECDEMPWTFN